MQYFNIPNCVCYLRVILCFYSFWLFNSNQDQIVFLILTLLIMLMDALDGYLARLLKQTSVFGAKLDIYSDRIVELSYWFFFAYLGRLGFWVFALFLVRGLIVDFLSAKSDRPLGNSWLRSSRFMRFVMGLTKILSFVFLIIAPEQAITLVFIYSAVISNLLRAYPVISNSLKSAYNKINGN